MSAEQPTIEPKVSAILFGHMRLISTRERKGDKIYLGGYSIRYDRNGIEVSRTENRWNLVVSCGDERTARLLEVLS